MRFRSFFTFVYETLKKDTEHYVCVHKKMAVLAVLNIKTIQNLQVSSMPVKPQYFFALRNE